MKEMSKIEKITRDFMETMYLEEGDVLLVALSGGKDSVVLFHVLTVIQKNLKGLPKFFLAVGHFNHQSREGQSDADQAFVESLVEQEGDIPCYIGTEDVSALALQRKQGFEETARQVRYEFLEETADKLETIFFLGEENVRGRGCHIFTAHHAQDNIETVFLNLARGTGLQGLCGMPPWRDRIYRPFLKGTLEEIQAHYTRYELSHREDLSNLDEKFRRNRLRHQVIPEMIALNPQFLAHTVNTIGIITEENNYLNHVVRKNLPVTRKTEWQGEDLLVLTAEIPLKDFLALPRELWGRALQYVTQWIEPDFTLSLSQREQILQIAQREKPSGIFSVSSLLQIRREYGKMIWCRPQENPSTEEDMVPLEKGGSILWHGWRITLTYEQTFDVWDGKEVMYFPEKGHYYVRSRQVGDMLKPERRSRKTVKKWCIEEKIPAYQREHLPVILGESGEIVAVAQIGTQEGASPPRGSFAWRCTIEPEEEKESSE